MTTNLNAVRKKSFAARQWLFSAMLGFLFFWNRAAIAQLPPFYQCPAVGTNTSCSILILITTNRISVKSDPSQGPYDGQDDTLVGILNLSGKTLRSLPLSSPIGIFGFDGDGLFTVDPAPPGAPYGPTGYEGPGVRYSNINPSATAGVVRFDAGLAPGQSTYFGLEEAIQTLCVPIQGVPLLKQGGADGPWGTNRYASLPLVSTDASTGKPVTNTISKWGCYLTCAAMLIDFHAINQFSTNSSGLFTTTPDKLNIWLRSHNGYSRNGRVVPNAVAQYARTNGVELYYQGALNYMNDFVTDLYLCATNPVLLNVASPGTAHDHFVLATGETKLSGNDTFLINDPAHDFVDMSPYQFDYKGLRLFTSIPQPLQALVLMSYSSNVDMVITDPFGNQSGFNPVSGQALDDIPSSSYLSESLGDDDASSSVAALPMTRTLDIPSAGDGSYTLRVFAAPGVSHSVDLLTYDSDGNSALTTINGTGGSGGFVDYTIDYNSDPGSPTTVVAPQNVVTASTFYSFVGTWDGAYPAAGLTLGKDGNFYGTTQNGGTNFAGAVFKITPAGVFTPLYSFGASQTSDGISLDGYSPSAGLVLGLDGNLYGTTTSGGAYTNSSSGSSGFGTVFQITPDGALTTLYSFGASQDANGVALDGAAPAAALLLGQDGNFYGTTQNGGQFDQGTVFQIAPGGALTTLYSFGSNPDPLGTALDGANPLAALVQDQNAVFYGTTSTGGEQGVGTIFTIGVDGTLTTLYSFPGAPGGDSPLAPLIQGIDGQFYGTTQNGGPGDGGTVFRMSPGGAVATLASFHAQQSPIAALYQAADGALYGMTEYGSATDGGTLFIMPTNGVLTTLVGFYNTYGSNPLGSVIQGPDGALYGSTSAGGIYNSGTLFRVDIAAVAPTIQTVTQSGSSVTLTWAAQTGRKYQLQYKSILTQAAWSDLGSSITATSATATATDNPGGASQRYYRLAVLP